MTKPFNISKTLVYEAYKLVKANQGSAGIDQESLDKFDLNLQDNLYKLWNRLSSGSYFPSAVKAVLIPKKQGGERLLGIPTVGDRICQMVVKLTFEPKIEPIFHNDSYGYRPRKSAHDALNITRKRCWKYNWLLEFDIKGLFDNIDHTLLMKAVAAHTDNKWVLLYIRRWLKAPIQMPDGQIVQRTCGTPQGGVISPILSNLFLHYVFDMWMTRNHNNKLWARYADDGIIHCTTEAEAQSLVNELQLRFAECKLELHPTKTKIIYCKDQNRTGKYPNISFKFLGYEFRCRSAENSQRKQIFASFLPAVGKDTRVAMNAKIRKMNVRNRTDLELTEIAKWCNPILEGWINYYGKFYKSALMPVLKHFNETLVRWVLRKYKNLRFKHQART
jgi:RNA-directed DNA polymerase